MCGLFFVDGERYEYKALIAVSVLQYPLRKKKERFGRFLPRIRHYTQSDAEVTFEERNEAPKGQSWVNEDVRQDDW